ncbi:MAG: PBSX family phage terminase large subunit [Lachnospiraceae bacterium]|nr:PBSX family phage terminase large subunit [Lachnospiraceae bacterium]
MDIFGGMLMNKTIITLDDLIPHNFDDVLMDVLEHRHTHYIFKGGRGSCKSSFVSIVIILLMTKPENRDKHCIIFRKTANTLRDSVFSQMQFAISALGLDADFKCTVSPMKITYVPTGQVILFRGVDDKMKLKSLKAPFGYFAFSWLEEADTFSGMAEIRNILQSSMRGGSVFWCFMSFNPPISINNFMNEEVLIERADRLVHSSDYRTVPMEWLGEQFFDEAEHLKATNEKAYRHEYLGEAVGTGGAVFEFLEFRTITDEEISRMDRIFNGTDWGFFPDPYAFVRSHYDKARETIYLIDELYKNKWSNQRTAQWILDKGYNDFTVTCDSAEPKSVVDYRDMGIPARGAVKGAGSVEYGMKWLQRRHIVVDMKRTPRTGKELKEYEYERDKDGNFISGYPDASNHGIDALRYSYEPLYNKRGNRA